MTRTVFWSCISSLITTPIAILYFSLLTDRWRLPPRKRRPLLLVLLLGILTLQFFCLRWLGWSAQGKLAVGLLNAALSPALLLTLAPWRQGRLLFTLLSAAALSDIATLFVSLFALPYGPLRVCLKLLLNLVFLLLLYFLFRPSFLDVLQSSTNFWYGLSLIPLLFIAGFSVLLSQHFAQSPYAGLRLLTFIFAALVFCTYQGFYYFFRTLRQQYEITRENAALHAQISAVARQTQENKRRSARSSVSSEDIARFLRTVTPLMRPTHRADALALLRSIDDQIIASRPAAAQFTANPLLNAVLMYFTEWAAEEGVSLTIRLALPPAFPMEYAGFAVVLSNALENAMHACLARESGEPRTISLCGSGTSSQFFLSVRNTFSGKVPLDATTGYPIALCEGHGYGTKSIAAFAAAHGGLLQYTVEKGTFCLKLLL